KVDAEFAKSDGECVDISLFVKNKLNDPSSFEHVQTTHVFWDDERVYVNVIFRAKNGFGAIRMGEYALIMDYDFNIKKPERTMYFTFEYHSKSVASFYSVENVLTPFLYTLMLFVSCFL